MCCTALYLRFCPPPLALNTPTQAETGLLTLFSEVMGCQHSSPTFEPTKLRFKDVHKERTPSQYKRELSGKYLSERRRRASTQGKAKYIKHYKCGEKTFSSAYEGDVKDKSLTLGEGSEGHVFKAVHKLSGLEVAVKVLDKAFLDEQEVALLRTEIDMLAILDHPNILRIIESYEDERWIYLVQEYCEGGALTKVVNLSIAANFSLRDRLKDSFRLKPGGKPKCKPLSESDVKHIIAQISEALAYLHDRNLAHRDLKLDNIMILEPRTSRKNFRSISLEEKGNEDEIAVSQLTFKIIDFGITEQYNESKTANIRGTMVASFEAHGVVGTGPFMAPEIVNEMHHVFEGRQSCLHIHKYDPQPTDCWALGVIAYTLIARQLPFPDIQDRDFLKKVNQYHLDFSGGAWKRFSPDARDFIQGLLVVNPRKRMTMSEALKHSWLSMTREGPMNAYSRNRGHLEDPLAVDGYERGLLHVNESLASFDAYCNHLCPFRRALVYHLAIFIPKLEAARLAQKFRVFDVGGNGIIEDMDMLQVLMATGKTMDEANECIDRFRSVIFGTSGELTFTRFIAAHISLMRFLENELFLQMLHLLFSQMDTDGDGRIDRADMVGGLVATEDITSCWPTMIKEMVQFLVPEDRDAQNAKVDFEQFKKYFDFKERPGQVDTRIFLCHDGTEFTSPINKHQGLALEDVRLKDFVQNRKRGKMSEESMRSLSLKQTKSSRALLKTFSAKDLDELRAETDKNLHRLARVVSAVASDATGVVVEQKKRRVRG